ncbi:NAD(P)/FAD-dependent oxidoreductase [Salinisphaera orenii]|uniref:NAD(P)/FAD-dependent oxidoreductase n=1 Tax=Salinisphaera orenii TaxID=856731 RepID=UPI000DBE80D7
MAADTNSFYQDSTRVELTDTEALVGAHQADVAVVGGGVTGCSAALYLAEQGYDVALIEAHSIGWGASGRSGGQILSGFGTDMDVIAKSVGLDAARQAWEMSREAVRLTADRVRRYAIDCNLQWGAIDVAAKPRQLRALSRTQQHMRDIYGDEDLVSLDRDALWERVRSPAYLGGLYDPNSGHLHPLNYTLGLARAAQAAGARIFEASRVERLTHGRPAQLTAADGTLTADFVVLAGNAYLSSELAPNLRDKLMPVKNYMVATQPLSAHQVAQTLPYDNAVADSNFVLDYYHLSEDRRMLYGGQVSYGNRAPRRLRARMVAKLQRLFPALEGVDSTHQWGGLVGVTRNRAPHLGRLDSNVYFAQGYSGHGMAFAGLSGKLIGEAIAGQAERFDLYTKLDHRRFPGGDRLRTPLLVLATNFYRMRDWL